jgi:predicted transcriptional regulator
MIRAFAGPLALIILFLPAAWGQTLSVEGGTESGLGATGDAGPPDRLRLPSVPDADLPLHGVLPGHEDASVASDHGPTDADAAVLKESRGAGLPPEARRAATAVSAGAGLALLVGLIAHALGVPLFSRIQSSRLLDNGVRQRVHDTIVANPGITIKEVAGVCAIGWGTTVYHLKRLEAERLIVSERNRQFSRYFKNGGGIVNETKAAYGELKNPVTERLAHSIVASPGRCQKDLCAAVGISAPLAHKFLSRLAQAGLVSTQREWKTVRYFPTPRLQDLLLLAKAAPVAAPTTPLALAA